MSIKKYQFLLNNGKHPYSLPEVILGDRIPKTIYQTYKSWDALKPELKKNIDYICKLNPGWSYHFFDDENVEKFILAEYGSDILKEYVSISPELGPARADLFRYLLLYKKGGVYLDIKTTLTQPLDSVLRDDDLFILSHWEKQLIQPKELKYLNYKEYIQWAILSTCGHPFLKEVLHNVLGNLQVYNPWLHGVGKKAVLRITGPYAYTCAIEPKKLDFPHRFANVTQDLGIHYSLYELGTEIHCQQQTKNHMSDKNHYSKSKQLVVNKNTISSLLYRVFHKN